MSTVTLALLPAIKTFKEPFPSSWRGETLPEVRAVGVVLNWPATNISFAGAVAFCPAAVTGGLIRTTRAYSEPVGAVLSVTGTLMLVPSHVATNTGLVDGAAPIAVAPLTIGSWKLGSTAGPFEI